MAALGRRRLRAAARVRPELKLISAGRSSPRFTRLAMTGSDVSGFVSSGEPTASVSGAGACALLRAATVASSRMVARAVAPIWLVQQRGGGESKAEQLGRTVSAPMACRPLRTVCRQPPAAE